MQPVMLTPHQQAAIDACVAAMEGGATLFAIRGLAGTGKTSLIPHLLQSLEARGIYASVGTPTHRAAMILRRKGITKADTVHSLALLPSFSPDYARAAGWLGENARAYWNDDDVDHGDVTLSADEQAAIAQIYPDASFERLPWLVYEACKTDLAEGVHLRSQRGRWPVKRLLEWVGIKGDDHFRRFIAREAAECLILDESSMIDEELLAKCQQAFPRVILLGDPGQLPPIDGPEILSTVPGVELTEIHRQAAESPIVQLAYKARRKEAFWQESLTPFMPAVESAGKLDPRVFLESPLLVYRNVSRTGRVQTCLRIRQALGYPAHALVVGEPLVCRSTDKEDRQKGLYNNSMWRIMRLNPDNNREVTILPDPPDETAEPLTVLAHIEEIDGDRKHPGSVKFRWGYAITVHTAQGGEWPTGYISWPELLWYRARCWQEYEGNLDQAAEEVAKWAYTAITRAKNHLVLVKQHEFVSITHTPSVPQVAAAAHEETPMPLFSADPIPEALVTSPPDPDPLDDIPDPVVPLAATTPTTPPPGPQNGTGYVQTVDVIQAMDAMSKRATGHLEALHDYASSTLRTADSTYQIISKLVGALSSDHTPPLPQLVGVLEQWAEKGLLLRGGEYQCALECVTPEGYPVTVTLRKSDAAEFVQSLGQLSQWLKAQGYGVR